LEIFGLRRDLRGIRRNPDMEMYQQCQCRALSKEFSKK
jgi:hypothetical protein